MHELLAEFEVVTPAFCGGVDNKTAEIRLPSILGQIRWWWRALAWSRTSGTDPTVRLDQIHKWEALLFGSSEDGTGAFTACLKSVSSAFPVNPADSIGGYGWDTLSNSTRSDRTKMDGLLYLAGQGLSARKLIDDGKGYGIPKKAHPRKKLSEIQRYERKNYLQGPQDIRSALPKGGNLKIEFRSRRGVDLSHPIEVNAPTLDEALNAFGLLGGVGSRWRRGFGSLMRVNTPPVSNISDYRTAVRELLCPTKSDSMQNNVLAPYSTVGVECSYKVVEAKSGEILEKFHDRIGTQFQTFRTNWRKRPGSRFWGDHEWFYVVSDPAHFLQNAPNNPDEKADAPYPEAELVKRNAPQQPERLIFGLPHNYYSFRNGNRQVDLNARLCPSDQEIARRASPLFLHLHLVSGQPVAVWYHLNCCFLPPGATLVVSPAAGHNLADKRTKPWELSAPRPADISPIDDFLKIIS